uniref:Elongation factor G n=1 Tax=Candidatus Kentrum sp. SD TaxID=2126332 RepID=A0A450YVU2_9GAMM|nr:MAG: elongation factor G [Candidatus Kentron sp. SD]VFK45668.1 MAG: elongation factor G [Candidatus Kentron sp. SD]VFK79064.1 MAG: elongation factor G [Candidatus Kentron sp. SD]
MPNYTTPDIRNITLVGQGGAGKTTLMEALLHKADVIPTPGDVTKGTTVCDFDPQEKEHQRSLHSALVSFDFDGKHVNLIDTPGYPDFIGRAITILPAVETAALVVDARVGIEMGGRRMMESIAKANLCRMIIINKTDAEEIDLANVLQQVNDAFGPECLPLNLPTGKGSGVADCFFSPEEKETDFSSISEAHTRLVEQIVEMNEELMERYLEQGEDVDPDALRDAFKKALREGHLVPVCFTSAQQDIGISELLDIFAQLMPNPQGGNPTAFRRNKDGDTEEFTPDPDPEANVLAHVFKVFIDPFVGRLGVFRIHQGTITKDSQLFVSGGRKPFKVGHLFKLQGKDHIEVEAGIPGDLCAVTKVEEIHFDTILHDSHDDDEVLAPVIESPTPMFGLAIQAKTRGDEQKLSDTLHKLDSEDPSFLIEQNVATHETVIRGLGELHLRIMLERMKERYHVEVDTRPPRIAYRETITMPAEGHHRHKKQTGGAGQFGEVFLRVEPLPRGSGFEFVDAIVGGVIPQQFIPAVEKGIRQVLESGAIAGYTVEDIRVAVYDGKYHPVDSKEIAFISAGKKAFMDAISKAKPIVLEPIVNIDVTVPQDNMGDIAGGISGKRGKISGTNSLGNGMVTVAGQVPLSELEMYQSELKSVSGGAGMYTIAPSHYDPVPAHTQQQLMADFKPGQEEE